MENKDKKVFVMVRWKPEMLLKEIAMMGRTRILHIREDLTIEQATLREYLSAKQYLLNKRPMWITEIQLIKLKNKS